jgi:hypothetical protein
MSDPELELEKMETFDISIDQDANGDWWWNASPSPLKAKH